MRSNDPIFSEAVKHFWDTRSKQADQQVARGQSDQGSRSAVTGGRQMDGFVQTLTELMMGVGVAPSDIHSRGPNTTLPGFFRPTKGWDLVVVVDGQLVAAIELKSQVGPSFGNNYNNRAEEALGTALDTWTAYREKAFVDSPAPWLGYLFLLEDSLKSRTPVRVREPHFPVFPEFKAATYSERYEWFCRRLVLERQYSQTCLLLTNRRHATRRKNYSEPGKDLSGARFVRSLLRHVRAL